MSNLCSKRKDIIIPPPLGFDSKEDWRQVSDASRQGRENVPTAAGRERQCAGSRHKCSPLEVSSVRTLQMADTHAQLCALHDAHAAAARQPFRFDRTSLRLLFCGALYRAGSAGAASSQLTVTSTEHASHRNCGSHGRKCFYHTPAITPALLPSQCVPQPVCGIPLFAEWTGGMGKQGLAVWGFVRRVVHICELRALASPTQPLRVAIDGTDMMYTLYVPTSDHLQLSALVSGHPLEFCLCVQACASDLKRSQDPPACN